VPCINGRIERLYGGSHLIKGRSSIMIRKASEMAPDIVENMRGGKGSAEVLRILKKEEFHDKGRLFGKITLKPGMSIGLHQHVGDCESFYILSGEGRVYDNGRTVDVGPGDLVYTDNEENHSIENIGKVDLVFMALILYV
jgi:mannose-6-phosphate isomerase-like protein (cupin superfamily)